ncbi:CW14 protein isoform 1 [Gossypium australe]|uniref:CW14 protein isoform 1 n=1 Tax=Gossypium australe TaxID=47621 RepID=A0A5B6U757_9ROSI|nr:CW14 protein isoform 1 [Gossypium australe]
MGSCVSRPEGSVCPKLRSSKKNKKKKKQKQNRKRRKSFEKRVSNGLPDPFSDEFCSWDAPPDHHSSFSNPTFQGSEELWFDPVAVFESDYDEDFESVQEDYWKCLPFTIYASPCADVLSLNGLEGVSVSSISSLTDANCRDHFSLVYQTQKLGDVNLRTKSDGPSNEAKEPVFLDDIASSVDEGPGKEDGLLDDCGILPSNCLPCLASTVPSIEKRRSLSSSPPISSKMLLQRPKAGSQVPFCPIEKKMFDCWSYIDPGTFKVRGENYFRDKKKDYAPNHAAYYPFGVDVFLSPRKIDHIARFVELPVISHSEKLPSILVVNVQIPLYPAALFQSETDGEGMSFVLYFKLSDSYSKELPLHFQENFRRLIDDEVEKVKGFPVDTIVPFRERLKILGRIANVEDLHMGAAERKLMQAYNEKPFLSRPQHEFYLILRICIIF